MEQEKIGKFIAERRKEKSLTQMQLAEKLGITDRAVSKWETGKSMPDASIMLELCDLLEITVNDLLSGEEIAMNSYNAETEKNLLEMLRQKEISDGRLLKTEVVLGFVSGGFLAAMIIVACLIQMPNWTRFLLIGIGLGQFLIAALFMIRIEQIAGYYECAECGYRYVPKYGSVNVAPHMGRSRYMKCPHCGEKSWQKKVLTKE